MKLTVPVPLCGVISWPFKRGEVSNIQGIVPYCVVSACPNTIGPLLVGTVTFCTGPAQDAPPLASRHPSNTWNAEITDVVDPVRASLNWSMLKPEL